MSRIYDDNLYHFDTPQPSYWEATATTSKTGRFRTASHPAPESEVARTNDAAADQTLAPDLVPALPPSSTTTSALLQGQIGSHGVIGPRSAATQPNNFRDLTESEMLSIALASSPVLRPLGLRILENPAATGTSN